MDATKTQLEALISHEGKPVASYSRKSIRSRINVETPKGFRNICLQQQQITHIDHTNLTYNHVNSDRAMGQRLIIEEYFPDLQNMKGDKSAVANALITKCSMLC
jgi:hypothetical protein